MFNEKLDEVAAETGKSVTVGNHNLELVAAQEAFQ
jgi:hypothetical protein